MEALMDIRRPVVVSLVTFSLLSSLVVAHAGEAPVIYADGFELGKDAWVASDPPGAENTWEVVTLDDNPYGSHALRSKGGSKYRPPYRSPFNFVLLREVSVKDFTLEVKLQNTNLQAGGHADLCLFWGYQNPSQFYYVHLGAEADPHSCQIFIVNEAPRTKITKKEAPGTPWTEGWHSVKIVRDTESGLIEVYFDDMDEPMLTAEDTTFTWGRVGLGTFDDHGNFTQFQLQGFGQVPPPDAAKLPHE